MTSILPLNLKFDDFRLTDTANFNLNAVPDHGLVIDELFSSNDLSQAFISVVSENKFPFHVLATISLLDDEGKRIDTLVENLLVVAPDADPVSGVVAEAKLQVEQIQRTHELLSNIERSTDFIIDITLSHAEDKHYHLRSDYFLNFSFVLDQTYVTQ